MVKSNEKSRCPCCKKNFKQLKRHLSKNPICKQYVFKEVPTKKKNIQNLSMDRDETKMMDIKSLLVMLL